MAKLAIDCSIPFLATDFHRESFATKQPVGFALSRCFIPGVQSGSISGWQQARKANQLLTQAAA
jgi:hypothetical protein